MSGFNFECLRRGAIFLGRHKVGDYIWNVDWPVQVTHLRLALPAGQPPFATRSHKGEMQVSMGRLGELGVPAPYILRLAKEKH